MDIIPGRENNQAQPERAANAKTETEEKIIERPSARRQSEPLHHRIKEPRSKFKPIAIIVGVIVVLAIVVSAFLFINRSSSTEATINGNEYQAVFLTSGQVYFGKLKILNNDYMKLTDIFYLQAKTSSSSVQDTSTDASAAGVDLIKLGNEIHGPEDAMMISKTQVIFFENLKNSGKVATTINSYQKP
jgi:hypothetical protein